MRRLFSVLIVLTVMAAAACGQQEEREPRVTNARLQTRSAARGLESEFRALVSAQPQPAWLGYSVPAASGRFQSCCSENCSGPYRLEEASSSQNRPDDRAVTPAGRLMVLFRLEDNKVVKLRTFSEGCELDAGGLPFHWLTGVRPAESVALLSGLATGADTAASPDDSRHKGHRPREAALGAIAMHADAAADNALEQFVAAAQPEALRQRAVFWLGTARGRRGFEAVLRLARQDPSEQVRDRAVFALSTSKEPEAVDELIRLARNDQSSRIRSRAIFWLGQKAGQKAAATINDAIANDPETEVKRAALFALTRLPKDESIPLLIQVARTNRNPEVRRQAMFWLGQSKDPRALDFFEQVLSR